MISLQTLEKLSTKTIALIGDLILDRYTFGATHRVSPEAPVPVLSIVKEDKKAGGAGNVALNLRALGMNVKLMGRLGSDVAGDELIDLLSNAQVDCSYCLREPSYRTSAKTRFIASSQQLLRVDHEETSPLGKEQEKELIDRLDSFLEGVDVLAISDYAKGLLTNSLLQALVEKAKARGLFIIVDPKGADFTKYKGASLIKPNFMEAINAVPHSERVLERAAPWISHNADIPYVMVTKSEHGIFLYTPKKGLQHFPVAQREVRDSTGAGDTVLATLAAARASGLSLEEAISLSNLSGSIVVGKVGCAAVTKDELAFSLLDHNPTGKILSYSAFHAIESLFSKKKTAFFSLPSTEHVTLREIKHLKAEVKKLPEETIVIVLFPDQEPEEHALELVSGMESVDWVVYGVSNMGSG